MPENKNKQEGINIDVKINFSGLAKAVGYYVAYKLIKDFIYRHKED